MILAPKIALQSCRVFGQTASMEAKIDLQAAGRHRHNTARTMTLAILAIELSLGLITFALSAPAQQLDRPDTIQSFRAGRTPNWLAFDGANIWVTNSDSHMVTKLRASDGARQGSFPAGGHPQWITFDGTDIWVSDSSFGGNLIKLRASDGTLLFTVPDVGTPEGTAWDGANIWVAGFVTGRVTKIRGSDGAVLGMFLVGQEPLGV